MRSFFILVAMVASAQDSYLIRNATIHPVTGPEMVNGSLLIEGGKITGIGAKLAAPKGVKVIEAKGMHAWPGMVNCATQIGLSEVSSVRETNDTNEIGEFIPQVRAIVAVNPETEHILVARANGLTSVLTLPAAIAVGGGPGAPTAGQSIVRGQAAMIRMDGWTWEDLAMSQSAGMLVRFPAIQTVTVSFPGGRSEIPFVEAKRRYDAEMRKIDEFFEKARRYQQAKAAATATFLPDMQLEAMRMNNKFSFEIIVDESIDPENTLIPPLILQPFVENAIWHGFSTKEGQGKITIHIQQEDQMLKCTVQDNGIGRQKSGEQKNPQPEKKSLGMKITRSRIDIINKIKKTRAGVEITDLPQGTSVIVKLPLELDF